MKRSEVLCVVSFTLGALLLFPASLEAQKPGESINRPGGDYRSFDLARPAPRMCQQACESEEQCRAWTYVRPGLQGARARCWLKDGVPPPVEDECCVSGVDTRAGELYQEATNRPGADYSHFVLNRPEPALCEAACSAQEHQCRSWTYVTPGIQGPSAHCWLKRTAPAPQPDSCCVSGVRRK